ncbi:hypothetical protein [Tritonibacter scottomollicae]|uniref:hypothetical protein n=1 Tax=Tritonibacter scottomollicae TaxID=483013 RepID=UPI003AA8B033
MGYLILFSDSITQHIQFKNLATASQPFLLPSDLKLQLIYFGLVFFATANFWYRRRRPFSVQFSQSPNEYVRLGMERFTVLDFVQIFGDVDDRDTGPITQYWEFEKSHFDDFIRDLETHPVPKGAGAPMGDEPHNSRQGALDRHSEFVRCLLLENYARQTRQRKIEQQIILLFCALAYLCLLIPSFDLFQAVLSSILI